jgi:glycosyltransferase involved in cell wall biosynthesis
MPPHNEPAVSIVVPVFNTESYLGECLDSILSQKFEDLEILCVDDGSTDGSVKILEAYAAADPRVRIIPQKPGGKGPGTARNAALDEARGEYIAFVDSDDRITDTTVQQLYKTAKAHDADIVMCTIAKFSDKADKGRYAACTYHRMIPPHLDQRTFSWLELKDVLFELRFVAWNKIYRRSFLVDAGIQSPKRQDPLFVLLGWKTGRFLFLPDAVPERMPITASIANLLLQDLRAFEQHEKRQDSSEPEDLSWNDADRPIQHILSALEETSRRLRIADPKPAGPMVLRLLVVGVRRSGKSELIHGIVKDFSGSRWAAVGVSSRPQDT